MMMNKTGDAKPIYVISDTTHTEKGEKGKGKGKDTYTKNFAQPWSDNDDDFIDRVSTAMEIPPEVKTKNIKITVTILP